MRTDRGTTGATPDEPNAFLDMALDGVDEAINRDIVGGDPRTMNTTFVSLIAAIMLALGVGCSSTVQESEEHQVSPDPANVAMDEEGALLEAFNAPVANSAASIGEAGEAFFTVCSLRVDNPHNSMHEPGTVNGVATVICLRPVQKIEMLLGLARDGHEVASKLVSNAGQAVLRDNVAEDPCVNGVYEGAAAAAVVFPPGSSPAENTLHANSSRISITCP